MKILFIFLLLISSSLSQDIFVEPEEKNLYRSAVEYSFDEILDNGAYTFSLENLSGLITITGHAGSGSHLIVDNRVHAVSNKNAIAILKSNQINVYHDKNKKTISIKNISERYDHKIVTTINLHIPINTNLQGFVKNGDVQISNLRGSVDLKTESVDAKLINSSGNIVFNTKGGNLDIEKTKGTIKLNMISGNINLVQCEGDIFTSSENGNIKLSNIKGTIISSTTLGDTEISSFDGTNGSFNINVGSLKINHCNADLRANIDIGDIIINEIKGNVELFTGKGQIDMNNITGSTTCNSNFGNISGNNLFGSIIANSELGDLKINKAYNSFLADHKIDLRTNRGSVSLRIPSDLPYYIQVHCDNLNSKDAITSETPLDERTYPTKVMAEGKIKSGTINCEIYSNYGPISIKTN